MTSFPSYKAGKEIRKMLKITKQILCLSTFLFVMFGPALEIRADEKTEVMYKVEVEQKKMEVIGAIDTRPVIEVYTLVQDEISVEECIQEEIRYGEMELIAQLVQAEAGNQCLEGKRLVVDVILNRVDSPDFPDNVEEVIFQNNQFSVIKNGAFDKASWEISDDCFEAVRLEYEKRTNYDVLYFSRGKSQYATQFLKCQDHWFGW